MPAPVKVRRSIAAVFFEFQSPRQRFSPTQFGLKPARKAATKPSAGSGDPAAATHKYSDVFASGYDVPRLDALNVSIQTLAGSTDRSLQAMLLQWFAAPQEPAAPVGGETLTDRNDPNSGGEKAKDDGDDGGDEEYKLKKPNQPTRVAKGLDDERRDQERIQKLLDQVKLAFANEHFCAERPAEQFAADLQLTAILLGTALRERWVTSEDYFDITSAIWNSLFLCGGDKAEHGWIAYRCSDASTGHAFKEALSTPVVTAALLGWAFGIELVSDSNSWRRYQFTLAQGAAQHPWLWLGPDEQQIAAALQSFMLNAAPHPSDRAAFAERIRNDWRELLRRGQALRELGDALTSVGCATLAERVHVASVRSGDLLWQGKLGYCLVLSDCKRQREPGVKVYALSRASGELSLEGHRTVPVGAVLLEGLLPDTNRPSADARASLAPLLSLP